jgi:Amt family ammonium transporter
MIVAKLVDATIGLRVTDDDEITGLDLSQHSEVGYALSESSGSSMSHVAPPAPAPSHVTAAVRVPQGGEA